MTQSLNKLYALINEEHTPVPAITTQNTVLESVRPAVGSTYNTQATLRALVGQGYEGSVTVSYRRLNLALLYSGYENQSADLFTTNQDVVDRLNAVRAADIELADLEAFTLPTVPPGGSSNLVLTAKADSYGFYGSVTLVLHSSAVLPLVDAQDATIEVETPPGPTVLLRDDFNGAADSDFVGRVPNISLNGAAYSSLSDGSTPKLVVDGNGFAYASGAAQEAAFGFLDYDAGTALRFEMSMRNADGVSELARTFDAIFTVQMKSNGQPNRRADFAISEAGALYLYCPDNTDISVPYTDPLGAGGAAVKFTFEWANGHLKFLIDDVEVGDLTINATGEPSGAGTLYIEFQPGNKVDYIQLSQLN